jgi:hypothetical protein
MPPQTQPDLALNAQQPTTSSSLVPFAIAEPSSSTVSETTVTTPPTTLSRSSSTSIVQKGSAPKGSEKSASHKKSRFGSTLLSSFKRKGKEQTRVLRPTVTAAQQNMSNLLAQTEASTLESVETPEALDSQIIFERKWKFASSAKNKLNSYIVELTKFMDALDHLTREKCGQGLIPASSASEKSRETLLRDTVVKTQGALERLHRALKSMNERHYRITLQVTNDFDKLGRIFAQQHDYFYLDEKSFFYFNLQLHSLSNRSAEKAVANLDAPGLGVSSTFVAESAIDVSRSLRNIRRDQHAVDLDQCAAAPADRPPTRTFEKWGAVFPPVPDDSVQIDVHWLFRDRVHSWSSYGTLSEALDRGNLANRMTVNQRLQLALIITNTYLYLARLKSMCQPITLQSFRYYALAGAPPVPPDEFNPLKFAPYIDFGYGRVKEIVIGSQTQASSAASISPALDLGLSLVQVARCLSHQYDSYTASSMEAARSWVQTCLTSRDLDYALPMDFAEIVRDCIEHSTQAQTIPGQFEKNQEAENTFLLDKVSRLQELESRFPATSRCGSLVPVPRESGNEDEI